MRQSIIFLCLSLLPTGCLTSGATRTIIVDPPDATITVDGFGECASPCTVKLDQRRTIRIARIGYLPQKFDIAPGNDPVFVTLELAAPSQDVDETELPQLD